MQRREESSSLGWIQYILLCNLLKGHSPIVIACQTNPWILLVWGSAEDGQGLKELRMIVRITIMFEQITDGAQLGSKN